MTERPPSYILPRDAHIAALKHQRAERHRLCTRPVDPFAALNAPETTFHMPVQPRMYFLRRAWPVSLLFIQGMHSTYKLLGYMYAGFANVP